MTQETRQVKQGDANASSTCSHAAHIHLRPGQVWFFVAVFLTSTLLLGYVLWPFWSILVFSFLLAGIFRPIYLFLARSMKDWFASALTCLLIFLIIFVPLFFCISALSSEALSLYQIGRDENFIGRLASFIQNNTLLSQAQELLAQRGINFEPVELLGNVSDLARGAGLYLYDKGSSWAANIMTFVLNFCILLLVVFFLLIDLDRLVCFFMRLSPLPSDQEELLMQKFMEIGGAILMVNGLSGLFQGTLGGLFFLLLGLKSPLIWGGVMAILAFLPIFGIGLVLLPASIILFIGGYFAQAVLTLLFYLALSFSIEYLVKPKFVGKRMRMHTLLVFLAIIGGMNTFGVLGIVYGPLIATVFLTLAEIYLKSYHQFFDTDPEPGGKEK